MEANSVEDVRTLRLAINAAHFTAAPVRTIKQLIGPNAQLLSYRVSSILLPSNELLIDITYKSLTLSPFVIYYIPINTIKHLIPNSEKYTSTINGITIKLNNPKLNEFKDYLPVRVKPTMINNTDYYEKYYSTIDGVKYELTLNDPASAPIAYFTTTVTNPLNALLTPLSLLNDEFNYLSFGYGDSSNTSQVVKLYPDNFTASDTYNLADTVKYYKQTLSTIPSLSSVENISTTFDDNIFNIKETVNTTAYVIPIDKLPTNKPIFGIILIQAKRKVDMLLYYPINTFRISVEELKSIHEFMKNEMINYNNYHYLKK